MILKRQTDSRPRTRRPASSKNQNLATGPDPLFFDEAEGIFLRKTIDVAAWSRGESSPPGLAKKFKLTGWLRELPDHEMMERIIAEQAKLRREIAGSSQLVSDFEFFLVKMAWWPEKLLDYLYWDSDMMCFSAQTMVSSEKKRKWSIDRADLQKLLKRILILAVQVERLGERLNPADEEYLPRHFRDLLHDFRCSVRDRLRKLTDAEDLWRLHKTRTQSAVNEARRTSFYRQIRTKTGKYHADRLCRLVNAAREARGIPTIEKSTFTTWLRRLKTRHR